MLILGMIAFGVLIGWVARTILGRSDLSWGRTILFGILGSFVGGLIVSLISGGSTIRRGVASAACSSCAVSWSSRLMRAA